VALVTPNGTVYRLSDRSFQHPAAEDRGGMTLEDDRATGEVASAQLDDVFVDEDGGSSVALDDDDDGVRYGSVFDFAIACLRRQQPHRTAVVSALPLIFSFQYSVFVTQYSVAVVSVSLQLYCCMDV